MDSAGVVRMTKRRFQNEWIQIADTRKVRDHTFSIEKKDRQKTKSIKNKMNKKEKKKGPVVTG